MKMKKLALLLCLMAALLLPLCALADAGSLSMVQVYQESGNATRLHVRLEGSADGSVLNLRAEDIAEATIGTGTVPVLSVYGAQQEQFGGMRYVFVLDHAMPISGNRVDQMKDGMYAWINALGQKDAAAVIISEREEVRVVSDFTSDKDALRAAVDDYGRGNEHAGKNMIYSGIKQAIDLICRNDPSLPRSSCIVVCSNGADTYQTLVTAEQLAQLLKENSIPLYVAGFAYSAQKDSLVGLMNIARNSNGWCEDATPANDQQTLDAALGKLRARIMGGYDILLDCSDGFVFNGATLVSIRLKNPDVIVKQTADLYLLKDESTPTPKPAPAVTAAPVQQDAGQASQSVSQPQPAAEPASWLEGETVIAGKALPNMLLIAVGGGAVLLIVLVVLIVALSTSRKRRQPSDFSFADQVAPIPDAEDLTQEKTMTGNGLAPAIPVMSQDFAASMPADYTPAMPADGKTTRVRGGAAPAMPAINDIPVTGMAQPDESALNKTARVRRGSRQVGSFVPTMPEGIEQLVIEYTVNGQSQRFELNNPQEITIGRLPGSNTLVLEDLSVSGQHARIICEGKTVTLYNVSPLREGARNRLCVDRREIAEQMTLHSGAHLTIGSVSASISWTEAAARPASQLTGDMTIRAPQPDVTTRVAMPTLEVVYTLQGEEPRKQVVRVMDKVIIGRGDHDTVRIQDTAVSRGHLIVTVADGVITVANGSMSKENGKNPFYYNGQRVLEQITYAEGQEILAGRATIRMRLLH